MPDFLLLSITWLESLLSKKIQILLEAFPSAGVFPMSDILISSKLMQQYFFSVVILMGFLSSNWQ